MTNKKKPGRPALTTPEFRDTAVKLVQSGLASQLIT
jgi:hypothetical protein